jgi:FAD synthase
LITISGKVVKGEGYGRVLGFPTANLDRRSFSRRRMKIRLGVYAGYVELPSGKKYRAAVVIGPIDKSSLPKIEAHLIGFKGNLYNTYLNIYLNRYIRPFKKFKNTEELKKQIASDIIRTKTILKQYG